jgi:F5/8 type C domain-containing protein
MNELARNIILSFASILGVIIGLEDQNSDAIPYKVKVTFDSITVHNDRDGFPRGAGEWYMAAYIQGQLVYFEMQPDDDDGTINFEPGSKEITVELTGTTPLSIFTFGYEFDRYSIFIPTEYCEVVNMEPDITQNLPIFHDPGLDWSSEIENYMRDRLQEIDTCDTDRLGRINEFYDAPEYGAGPHGVKSHSGDFTLNYTISVSKTAKIPPIAPGPLQRVCNSNLPITSVTASGNDGNVPQNALDNNLNTRWSSDGVGQFITADLGSTKNICSVDIAWYRGNERQSHFIISTSTDGTTFTNRFSSDSSGTTLNSEKYPIAPTDARYVRVTVNGNTVNNFASITELDIFG